MSPTAFLHLSKNSFSSMGSCFGFVSDSSQFEEHHTIPYKS